jgi:maltooligosyltrehalose trehalohydrolase
MRAERGSTAYREPTLGAVALPAGGVRFAAWAPERGRVEVEWAGPGERRGRTPLERGPQGVWSMVIPEAAAGTLYAFYVDGNGPFPDPYARELPEGVHRRGRVVDPGGFRWTDQDWPGLTRDGLVVYELHVGTFTPEGTFDAIIPRLDDLKDLGITAIELMPISSFPGRRNWGYDGVGHYAPATVYGGPEGLHRLVDAAHRTGLGIILDVVYNHLGPAGNYLRQYAPEYFTDRHQTPWGDAINYDGPGSRVVRDWAIDNAVQWIVDYHVDGLRLDATAEIKDESPVHLLRELAQRSRAAVERPIVLIAEDNRNDPRLVRPPSEGGYGLDAVWADDFHHALRTLLRPEREGYYAAYTGRPADLLTTIRDGFLYQGQVSPHSGKPRGQPTGDVPAAAFVFCTENHDQVGNRARGERLAHLVSPAVYRAASALLLLAPETPMLFMGQEFAASSPFLYFTDHEPELGRLVTEGRRAEFAAFGAFKEHPEQVPDPQDEATFRQSILDVADRERHAGVYRLYRDLLALRRGDPVLRSQDRFAVRGVPLGDRALAFTLGNGADQRLVVANFGDRLEVTLPQDWVEKRWEPVWSSTDRAYGGDGGRAEIDHGRVQVPPATTVLFSSVGDVSPAPSAELPGSTATAPRRRARRRHRAGRSGGSAPRQRRPPRRLPGPARCPRQSQSVPAGTVLDERHEAAPRRSR